MIVMPILDMPVTQLEKYTGSSPCPDDFDLYWETALKEMRSTDPKAEFIPAEYKFPNVECFNVYFTGVRGAKIHAKLVRPAGLNKKAPCVLRFHGYSGFGETFGDLLRYAALGWSAFSLDARGQGGYSEDTGGFVNTTFDGQIVRGLDNDDPQDLYYHHVFLDCAELANIALGCDFVDGQALYTVGGSQGGGLSLACAALEPRVARCFAGCPFLSDYKRVWHMDLDKGAYRDIRYYFKNYDPTHAREDEVFSKLGYIDVQNLANRIRGEILMITGLQDNTCPPSTQYAAYNKVVAPKKHIVAPDCGHENIKFQSDIEIDFLANGIK